MSTDTKKEKATKFFPKPGQMALMPDISGNTINGLGETEKRRASPIYWHDPAMLAHGKVQKWFYTQNPDDPHIAKARTERQRYINAEVPPKSGEPVQRSAEDWTAALLTHASGLDLDLIGVAEIDPKWVFEGYEVRKKFVVMIGIAHDYDEISHLPSGRGGAEVVRQYARGTKVAKELAGWFRQQGHDATPHGGPLAGPMLLIPAALACGFGELGKHGSIINEKFGSSFRLACVFTDVPLVPTAAPSIGVDDFCANCQICSNACPPDAILPEKNWVRGEKRWYVDFDSCLPYFNENFGCGICIAVCPFSRPDIGPKLVEKLARRRARKNRV